MTLHLDPTQRDNLMERIDKIRADDYEPNYEYFFPLSAEGGDSMPRFPDP